MGAVIFDFDFTLADSSAGATECANYALRGLGLPEADAATIHTTIGLSLHAGFEALTGLADPPLAERFASLFVEHADRVVADRTVVYDYVPDVLTALRRREVPLGIVSTKFRYRIEHILAREKLVEHFGVIVGGEDVARHKPDPEALLLALDRMGCRADDAIYVGDHPVDARAARAAGVRFIATLTGTSGPEAFAGTGALALLPDLSALPATVATWSGSPHPRSPGTSG
jgi:phosphoglycolate phosphatase